MMLSDQKLNILHVILPEPISEEFRQNLLEKFKSIFQNYERYIINNPNHLIVLLNETNPEVVEKIILEMENRAQIKNLKYPDLGKNLFAYL